MKNLIFYILIFLILIFVIIYPSIDNLYQKKLELEIRSFLNSNLTRNLVQQSNGIQFDSFNNIN